MRVAFKFQKYGFGLAVAFLIPALVNFTRSESETFPGRSDTEHTPAVRIFEFAYQTTINKIPPGIRQVDVWMPYPKSDRNQEIFDIRVQGPGETVVYTEPEFGNAILYLSICDPQSRSFDIEMKFKVRRQEYWRKNFQRTSEAAYRSFGPEVEKFLKPEKLVPMNEQIRKWAEEVTKGRKTDLEKARAIYDYAVATLKYDKDGKGWGRGDLLYACDEKRGNCTDFHALITGFCRAVGIPAKFAIGFPLPAERGEGEIPGYHCWAEFYLKDYGWVPVDASEAWKQPDKKDYFFGALDENRVQLSIGRDIVLRPKQQGSPLNYFIYSYVEAGGKPFKGVTHKFYFKDVSDYPNL